MIKLSSSLIVRDVKINFRQNIINETGVQETRARSLAGRSPCPAFAFEKETQDTKSTIFSTD